MVGTQRRDTVSGMENRLIEQANLCCFRCGLPLVDLLLPSLSAEPDVPVSVERLAELGRLKFGKVLCLSHYRAEVKARGLG